MFNLFLEAVTKKYFQYKGRSNRREYGSFMVFNIILNFLAQVLRNIFDHQFFLVIAICYLMYIIIPSITLIVRRLHDINYSGYWILNIIIPILFLYYPDLYNPESVIVLLLGIGLILCLLLGIGLIFIKGTAGPNRYGDPPA